ncbi:MAG: hypothetical protein GY796_14820, partial [Chloroflexi bacterium]|nr:hypothetical protein [Chloroflexota bacterium]
AMANDRAWVGYLKSFLTRKAAAKEQPGLKQVDLFSQYVKVLEALARQYPLLLVLDDLQWADTGSINLLFHLGRQLNSSPILILGCYRPTDVTLGRNGDRHPLESVINEFQQYFGDIKVVLRQTGEKAFVDAFLDTQPHYLSPTFREAFYQQCRGHPLFTTEMLQMLQERGDLVQDEQGRWVEGPTLDWQTLPTKIEGVIAERIGRLPENLRQTLSIAGIEGEIFTAEVVAQVQGITEREMVSWLSNQLERKHRLVTGESSRQLDSSRQRVSQYRFRHILFQKYLYNSLDEAERIYLHGAVGNALEQLYGRQAGKVAVPLARHFQAAGLRSKAIDYLEKAGEQARQTYANQAVIDFFSRAMELDDRREYPGKHLRQATWERQVGEAYDKLGRLTESRDHLQHALTLLGRSLPTTGEKLTIGLLGQLMRQLFHRFWSARFSRLPQNTVNLLEAARVYWQLARIYYNLNEKKSAIYAGLQALNLAEQAGPSPLLARLYGGLSVLIGVIPIHPLAKLYQDRALETAQNTGHLHTLGFVLEATGIYYLGVGQWGKTQAQLERANEIFEQLGDRHQGLTSRFILAGVFYYQGEFTQSEELFED